jgi:dynein heavy chain
MTAEYLPKLLGEKSWPEGVKKEFVAQLHKFMAALTEASHASKGRTTLYIPNEDLSDVEAAAKDKDLLQRLESTVIYWTRQIKEVTSNQHSQNSAESQSPLDEIKHWTGRTANLNILNI